MLGLVSAWTLLSGVYFIYLLFDKSSHNKERTGNSVTSVQNWGFNFTLPIFQ